MELKIMKLPKGYYVKEDLPVGFSYYNDKDEIIFQHPQDNLDARSVIWRKWVIAQERMLNELPKG